MCSRGGRDHAVWRQGRGSATGRWKGPAVHGDDGRGVTANGLGDGGEERGGVCHGECLRFEDLAGKRVSVLAPAGGGQRGLTERWEA